MIVQRSSVRGQDEKKVPVLPSFLPSFRRETPENRSHRCERCRSRPRVLVAVLVLVVRCQSDVLLRNLGVTYATPFARQEAFSTSVCYERPIDLKITLAMFSGFLARKTVLLH